MPIVFVISADWTLRAGVRAELRERGVEALGMERLADATSAIAAARLPSAIVLDCGEGQPEDANPESVAPLARTAPILAIVPGSGMALPISGAARVLRR
ncbi:MAG TPA: hypothetical protein VNL38_02910, partial [Candidatus Nitrosotenuis sp.]|nr:hypothetical protein [Candidatus Nitrosotenuis sp.]